MKIEMHKEWRRMAVEIVAIIQIQWVRVDNNLVWATGVIQRVNENVVVTNCFRQIRRFRENKGRHNCQPEKKKKTDKLEEA